MEQFTSVNTLSIVSAVIQATAKTCSFSRRYTWHNCLSKPNKLDHAVFFNLGHFNKIALHYIHQGTTRVKQVRRETTGWTDINPVA